MDNSFAEEGDSVLRSPQILNEPQAEIFTDEDLEAYQNICYQSRLSKGAEALFPFETGRIWQQNIRYRCRGVTSLQGKIIKRERTKLTSFKVLWREYLFFLLKHCYYCYCLHVGIR